MKLSLQLASIAVLSLASPALAQTPGSTATASANATATVLQPISVAKSTDLAFGSFVRPATGANTIVIDPTSGARTLSGGGNASLATSTTSRAAFTVGGEGAQTFSITVPASVSMTRSGGTETLPVTLSASGPTGALSGAAGSSGTATFGVGGSLPLDNTVVGGSYSGAFDVTVGYN
jgi:hypothetical protein